MSRMLIALVGAHCAAAGAADVEVSHFEPLQSYRIERAAAASFAKPSPDQPTELAFEAFGRAFALELQPNARVPSSAPGVTAYRGTLRGASGSWARIVLSDAGPSGLVFDGATLYAIETGADTAAEARAAGSGPIAFRLDDVYLAPEALSCAAGEPPATAAAAVESLAAEVTALEAAGAVLNLDLGVLADTQFAQAFVNPEAAILTRLNNVDGIFSEQVGVQITAAEVTVFRENDPFTTNQPSDLLDEVAIYRGATARQDALGLTHLLTGRNLDGMTAGIAFIGSVCSRRSRFDSLGRSFGAGLSEARRGPTLDSLVAAHEIGHAFGAPHDAEAGSACASTPSTFLMAPRVSGADEFSQCSLEQMQPEIASARCLTPIGAPDIAVSADDASRTVLAGAPFDYVVTVTNRGVDAATGVAAAVTAGGGLAIDAAAGSVGTCTVLGQTADCALGDLPGGTSRTVQLRLRGTAVGGQALDVEATTDADADLSNNDLAGLITVSPVVDLTLAGSAATVEINQQTTITAALGNAADYAAEGANLSITLSPGLRADEISLGGTACPITAAAATCAPRPIPPRGSASIALTVTGIAAGAQQITLGVTSAEFESQNADNSLVLPVSVTSAAASSGGGGGGGGATDAWLCAALAVLACLRRRPSRPRLA